jgi:hypothetical protein
VQHDPDKLGSQWGNSHGDGTSWLSNSSANGTGASGAGAGGHADTPASNFTPNAVAQNHHHHQAHDDFSYSSGTGGGCGAVENCTGGVAHHAAPVGYTSHALDHTGASYDDGEGNFVYSSGLGGDGDGGYGATTYGAPHHASAAPFEALVSPPGGPGRAERERGSARSCHQPARSRPVDSPVPAWWHAADPGALSTCADSAVPRRRPDS